MRFNREYWLGDMGIRALWYPSIPVLIALAAAVAMLCTGCALDAPMYGGRDKSPSVIEFAVYAGLFLGLAFAIGVAVGKKD